MSTKTKDKLVTSNQSDAVRNMANAKGVTRAQFQRAIFDGTFGRLLNSLKNELANLVPPKGARIHIIGGVKVKQSRAWNTAVDAAGNYAPGVVDVAIRRVGDQYPPESNGVEIVDILLINFPTLGDCRSRARMWAEANGLQVTNPREVFAIGEQHPVLHDTVGQNYSRVVATWECSYRGENMACGVWYGDSKQGADIMVVEVGDQSRTWFAYRK